MRRHAGQVLENRSAHPATPRKGAQGRTVPGGQGVRVGPAIRGPAGGGRGGKRRLAGGVPPDGAVAAATGVRRRSEAPGSDARGLADLPADRAAPGVGRGGGGGRHFGDPPGHHPLRGKPQASGARSGAAQSALAVARPAPPEPAGHAAGRDSASDVPVGGVHHSPRQAGRVSGAAAGERGERRRAAGRLAHGVVLEVRGRVPGLWGGGPVPAVAPLQSGTCG